jgi:hypothetical protein
MLELKLCLSKTPLRYMGKGIVISFTIRLLYSRGNRCSADLITRLTEIEKASREHVHTNSVEVTSRNTHYEIIKL